MVYNKIWKVVILMWKARHNQTGEILTGSENEIFELDNRVWTKWEVKDNVTRNQQIVAYSVRSEKGMTFIEDRTPVIGNFAFAIWNFPQVLILDRISRKLAGAWLSDQFGYPSL